MSTATKHERRLKRYKTRLKEIDSACALFDRMGMDPQEYRRSAIKKLHIKLQHRGRGSRK